MLLCNSVPICHQAIYAECTACKNIYLFIQVRVLANNASLNVNVHYLFLDLEMFAESMRHAYRGIKSGYGRVRALEAASSHTKKLGKRNKKSQPC